jgi:osmoprotectant transport system permease protein
MAAGTLHVTDLYATDAEIAYYYLRPLRDNLNYFPTYDAVILYRPDLAQRAPKVVALLLYSLLPILRNTTPMQV